MMKTKMKKVVMLALVVSLCSLVPGMSFAASGKAGGALFGGGSGGGGVLAGVGGAIVAGATGIIGIAALAVSGENGNATTHHSPVHH